MTIIGYQVVKTEVPDNSKNESSSEIGNSTFYSGLFQRLHFRNKTSLPEMFYRDGWSRSFWRRKERVRADIQEGLRTQITFSVKI